MEPEKTRQPLPTKKQHASQQINPSPPTAARPQHRTIPRRAPSIRYANRRIHTKIRTATPAAIAPTSEVPLPPAKARQASSRTIPVDGRPGSTLTVQDVPDQTHGMKRHTQFQSPTTSIRLETPISKNINLPKMEKVADDLETWRTRSNEKRGEYDAPIARMEASGTGLNRLTVSPVFGTPPRRPWQPWKWKAWQKARERESLASNGFDYIHN